jgi:hypothetical protein
MGIRATCKAGKLSIGPEFPVEPGLRSLPVLGEFFDFKITTGSGYLAFIS